MRHTDNLQVTRLELNPDLFPTFPNRCLDDGFTGFEVTPDKAVVTVLKAGIHAACKQNSVITD